MSGSFIAAAVAAAEEESTLCPTSAFVSIMRPLLSGRILLLSLLTSRYTSTPSVT